MELLFTIGFMIGQGFNHTGAGRGYWGLIKDDMKSDDTIRRALFSAISVVFLSLYLWDIAAVLTFPFWWLFSAVANKISLCAIHGRKSALLDALKKTTNYPSKLTKKLWKKAFKQDPNDLKEGWEVILFSTLYEVICNITLVPIIVGSALIIGNYWGMLAGLAFFIPALSYGVVGLWKEEGAGPRAEFLTGVTLVYILYIVKSFIPMWAF